MKFHTEAIIRKYHKNEENAYTISSFMNNESKNTTSLREIKGSAQVNKGVLHTNVMAYVYTL